MGRHPRAYWKPLVAEVESGAPVAEVARRHSVREVTLRWWRRRLRKDAPPPSVRLVAVTGASVEIGARPIEISCGSGVVLRVQEGTDVTYVATLVRALSAAC